jgi:hypothetical protein
MDPVFVALIFHVEIVYRFDTERKSRRTTNRAKAPGSYPRLTAATEVAWLAAG